MKQNFLTILIFSLSFALISCKTEDERRAEMLSGQWRGDMGMCYERFGQIYKADYTDIVFYPDYNYATHGYGKQVDFYAYGPVVRQYYDFDWSIHNGRITMQYYYEPSLYAEITDYVINPDRFKGYIYNTYFSLYKIADYYDWGYYDRYGHYYEWDRGYRSGTNGDSISAEGSATPTVRVFNRYMEQKK